MDYFVVILLMEESGDHQLRLVSYPIVYKVWDTSKRWLSTGFLNHQQYHLGPAQTVTLEFREG